MGVIEVGHDGLGQIQQAEKWRQGVLVDANVVNCSTACKPYV